MKKMLYLDYAATTPLDPEVFRAMLPFLKESYGNPSSIHCLGQESLMAIDKAREKVAEFLNCQSDEIIFTSSATEANNLAIKGLAEKLAQEIGKCHIITSAIEHHAVLEPCHQLEKKGIAKITYLPVNKNGIILLSDLKKALQKNTILVSIMYANNEIGTIQPIAGIGKLLKSKIKNLKSKIYFHTDAVQAINYLDCDVHKLGIDLLTLSAHKIYGPKGVGALYIKKGTPLEPQITGGGHEFGLRSGTENVAGIVGLGKAIEIVKKKQKEETKRIKKLRDKLLKGILEKIPKTQLNGSLKARLPNNLNFSFKGVEGEAIVIALDQEGIAVSTGSACSSKKLEPSHVLLALGLSPEQAHGSLRITLGRFTKEREINKVLKILPQIVTHLRKLAGFQSS